MAKKLPYTTPKNGVDSRILVINPIFQLKTTTTTTTLKTISTTMTSTLLPGIIPTVPKPKVLVPVLRPKPTLAPDPNSTSLPNEEYEICSAFPSCNPIGCGDPTIAPIDCEECNRAATSGTVFGMIMLTLLIVIANLLVIRVILRTPTLRRRHGYIKLSMATSDLLIGVFILPTAIVNLIMTLYYPYKNPGDVTKESFDLRQHVTDINQRNSIASIIFGTIAVVSVTSSLYNLLLLSLDRFLAIARPLKHRAGRFFPKKSLWMSIASVWIFGITLSAVPAFFPDYFAYGMDLATFVYVQYVTPPDVSEGGAYGFSPYYVTIIIGGPYILTVVLNILTLIFTWKSLKIRSRLSSRRTMERSSAVEKKCERNRRMKMLRKAFPEDLEDSHSSSMTSMFKKGTPRHEIPKRDKRHDNGTTSSNKKEQSWLVYWHSDDNLQNANESNNVSTDSEKSQSSQSPRFQRTRDQLHIVRDILTPSRVKTKAREFKMNYKTHLRVMKMIMAMMISFTICLMPYVIVTVKISDGSYNCTNLAIPFSFALYMLFLNSVMNFFIYNLCHPEFRHQLKKTFMSDYSKTDNWRRAAGSLFVASQKSTDSSMTYMTRTPTSTDPISDGKGARKQDH